MPRYQPGRAPTTIHRSMPRPISNGAGGSPSSVGVPLRSPGNLTNSPASLCMPKESVDRSPSPTSLGDASKAALSPSKPAPGQDPAPLLKEAENICNLLDLEDGCSSPLQRGVRRALYKLGQAHKDKRTFDMDSFEEFLKRVACAIGEMECTAPSQGGDNRQGFTKLMSERDEALSTVNELAEEGERLKNEMALNEKELVRMWELMKRKAQESEAVVADLRQQISSHADWQREREGLLSERDQLLMVQSAFEDSVRALQGEKREMEQRYLNRADGEHSQLEADLLVALAELETSSALADRNATQNKALKAELAECKEAMVCEEMEELDRVNRQLHDRIRELEEAKAELEAEASVSMMRSVSPSKTGSQVFEMSATREVLEMSELARVEAETVVQQQQRKLEEWAHESDSQMTALQKEVEVLRTETGQRDAQAEQLKEELEQCKVDSKRELDAVVEELREVRLERDQAEALVDQLEMRLQRAETEKEAASPMYVGSSPSKLIKAEGELAEIKRQHQVMSTKHSHMERMVSQMAAERDGIYQELQEAMRQHTVMSEQLEMATGIIQHDRCKSKWAQISANYLRQMCRSELQEVEELLAEWKQPDHGLGEALAGMVEALSVSNAERSALQRNWEEMKATTEHAITAHEQMEGELIQAKAALADTEARLMMRGSSPSQARELSQLRHELAEAKQSLHQARVQKSPMVSPGKSGASAGRGESVDPVQSPGGEGWDSIKARAKESRQQAQKLRETQEEASALGEANQLLQLQVDELSKQVAQLGQDKLSLETKLVKTKGSVSPRRTSSPATGSRLHKLKEENENLRVQLSQYSSSKLREENETLKTQLAAAPKFKDENDRLRRHLHQTQAKLQAAQKSVHQGAHQSEMDQALQEATQVIEANEEELSLARQSICDLDKALKESEAFVYSLAAALADAGDARGAEVLAQLQTMDQEQGNLDQATRN